MKLEKSKLNFKKVYKNNYIAPSRPGKNTKPWKVSHHGGIISADDAVLTT